jgi:membrane protease subunit HflC
MNSMTSQRFSIPLIMTGVAFLIASFSMFIVTQTEQALVLQFGKTKRTIQEPGLHFKLPFIENTVFYDKRLLDLNLSQEEVIATDQKRLVVDSYLRFKIVDPFALLSNAGQ